MSLAIAKPKPPSLRGLVRSLVSQAIDLREQLRQRLLRGDKQLLAAQASLGSECGREVLADETADALAQAIACTGPIIAAQPREWESVAVWFEQQASDWERCVLELLRTEYKLPSTQYPFDSSPSPPLPLSPSSFAHLYEHFLHAWQRSTRKRRGVFFTPQPIADYIVRQVDERLRSELGLPDGLTAMAAQPYREADASRAPFLLDPACGTGVFLLAVIDHLHRQLGDRWNDFVPNLLPRLMGIEILPAAAFLAKLNVALKLAATGYDFREPGKISIQCGDALDPNLQLAIGNWQLAIPILLGNPPFSSLSTNTNDWIARLVRGDEEIRGYVRAGGQTLGERKTWLHDDYVKFLRLAQWHVEQAGCGIVGFVTNHGYLDNATFRLMRSELLRVFSRIQIVDLHGNRKNGEVAPGGSRDENVFGLDQGTAIALLVRSSTQARSASEGLCPRVEYAELWGSRDDKLATLRDPSLALRACIVSPSAPDWRFVPSRSILHPDYDAGWLLTELMPVSTSAPVTARDHFVVACSEQELRNRIEEFRDLATPDDEIRQRYFTRTRSARYAPGDTRGWKLSAARQIVAADPDWQRRIVRCLYRPFDWRYVFWHPAMIDWPRTEVTRHLGQCGMRSAECGMVTESSFRIPHSELRTPLCLLARRQQLPTQPCTFFWVSDGLALDGVIRSDNRGSESLFPLYLFDDELAGQSQCRANFAPAAIEQLAQRLRLAWLSLGSGDLTTTFGPEDLLAYIYALFHSPSYRERYADQLRTGFPRVLPPPDLRQFRRWCALGRELIDLHLLRTFSPSPPRPLAPSTQEFRAGGYVALKKWLQPPHRSPADAEYRQIAAAIERTIELLPQIDAALLG